MKKYLSLVLCVSLVLSMTSVFALPTGKVESNAKVWIDGYEIVFQEGTSAVKEVVDAGDRNYLPVRQIAEALDATVYWMGESQIVQVVTEDRMIAFKIGVPVLSIYEFITGADGVISSFVKDLDLDGAAPCLDDAAGRTYIPLRAAGDPLLVSMETLKKPEITKLTDIPPMIAYDSDTDTVKIPKRDTEKSEFVTEFKGILSYKKGDAPVIIREGDAEPVTLTSLPSGYEDWAAFLTAQLGENYDGAKVEGSGPIDVNSQLPMWRDVTSLRIAKPVITLGETSGVEFVNAEGTVIENGASVPQNSKIAVKYPDGTTKEDWAVKAGEEIITDDFIKVTADVKLEAEPGAYKVNVPECFEKVEPQKAGAMNIKVKLKDGYYIDGTPKAEDKILTKAGDDERAYFLSVMPEKDVNVEANWVKIEKPEGLEVSYINGKISFTHSENADKYEINGVGEVTTSEDPYSENCTYYYEVESGATVTITEKAVMPEETTDVPTEEVVEPELVQ